ncbi:MAG: LysM peptidoglycan-binding domain-containing protein [Treponema sp.]|nr:LysM peptidoglycan-binding domain-containing protein [Treponema sp.]
MKSIGIKLADGSFYPILEEGKEGVKNLNLTTVQDNQTTVHVDLYRSETGTMEDAEYVDTLEIKNLNPHENGEPTLDLQIEVDADGKLSANIQDPETGKESKTDVPLVFRTLSDRNTEPVNFNIDEAKNEPQEEEPALPDFDNTIADDIPSETENYEENKTDVSDFDISDDNLNDIPSDDNSAEGPGGEEGISDEELSLLTKDDSLQENEENELIGPSPNDEEFSFEEVTPLPPKKEEEAEDTEETSSAGAFIAGAAAAGAVAAGVAAYNSSDESEESEESSDILSEDTEAENSIADETEAVLDSTDFEETDVPLTEESSDDISVDDVSVDDVTADEVTEDESASDDFALPDFDDGTQEETTEDIAEESVSDDFSLPDFDSSEENSSTDISEESVPDDFAVPDFDAPEQKTNSDNLSAEAVGLSGVFDDDYGEVDLNTDSEDEELVTKDPTFQPKNEMFSDLYDKETLEGKGTYEEEAEEIKKKTRTPVIICIVCAIICIIAVLLLLFIIPSPINLLSKTKKDSAKTEVTKVQEETKTQEQEPEAVFEEPEVAEEEPAPVENTEPAKEDEIVIAKENEVMVPEVPPVTEKKADITYKIKWGDTLWDISAAYYKNPWRYKFLARYNGIKNPDKIISGTYIKIPQE